MSVRSACCALVITLLIAARVCRGEISEQSFAAMAAKEWQKLSPADLASLVRSVDRMSAEIRSPAHLEYLVRLLEARGMIAGPDGVDDAVWSFLEHARDHVLRLRAEEHPTANLRLAAYLMADIGPLLRPVAAEADERVVLAEAFDALLKYPLGIMACFDPESVFRIQLLRRTAYYGSPGHDSFDFLGATVHNLSLSECHRYRTLLLDLTGREHPDGTRSRRGRLDMRQNPESYPAIASIDTTRLMRFLDVRVRVFEDVHHRSNRIRAALDEVLGYERVPTVPLNEMRDRALWYRQRPRAYAAARLLSRAGVREAIGDTIELLAVDAADTTTEWTPDRHPLVECLARFGTHAFDDVMRAYLADRLSASYTREILGRMFPDASLLNACLGTRMDETNRTKLRVLASDGGVSPEEAPSATQQQ